MSQTKSFIVLLLATLFACTQNNQVTLIQLFNRQLFSFNITLKKYRVQKFQSPVKLAQTSIKIRLLLVEKTLMRCHHTQ